MKHAMHMAAILALAATSLPEPRNAPETHRAPHEPEPVRDTPEAQAIRADLRERRRQNFLKQKKAIS